MTKDPFVFAAATCPPIGQFEIYTQRPYTRCEILQLYFTSSEIEELYIEKICFYFIISVSRRWCRLFSRGEHAYGQRRECFIISTSILRTEFILPPMAKADKFNRTRAFPRRPHQIAIIRLIKPINTVTSYFGVLNFDIYVRACT